MAIKGKNRVSEAQHESRDINLFPHQREASEKGEANDAANHDGRHGNPERALRRQSALHRAEAGSVDTHRRREAGGPASEDPLLPPAREGKRRDRGCRVKSGWGGGRGGLEWALGAAQDLAQAVPTVP